MELQKELIEFGLKNFFDLKYKKKEIKYEKVPELITTVRLLNEWLDTEENPSFKHEKIAWLEFILKKYYRSDFLKFADKKSIEEYLFEKESYGLEGAILDGLLNVNNLDDESLHKKWLLKVKKGIQRLQKYNRPFMHNEFIELVSFEEFQNENTKVFIKNYLTDELDSIFAKVHLILKLGLYEIQRPSKSSSEKTQSQEETPPPPQSKKPERKLSLRQIALIYVYSYKQITEHNGNEIAKKYNWTSGHKLWQHFNFYYQKVNRKGLEETKKKTKNKIKLIESVVDLLPPDNQEQAKDEVSILKKIYETEYQQTL